MRFTLGINLVMAVAGFFWPVSTARAAIIYSQSPDPYVALENTPGNIAFITMKNDDATSIAFVTEIHAVRLNPTGGEADDKATNLALVAPNPTVVNPLAIGPNGTANIKFSWDAVDEIKDNDVDFGDWSAVFTVDYFYTTGTNLLAVVQGHVRVTDPVPEPAVFSLVLLGLVGAILRKALTGIVLRADRTSQRNMLGGMLNCEKLISVQSRRLPPVRRLSA